MKNAAVSLGVKFGTVRKDTLSTTALLEMLPPIKENLYNFIFKATNFSEDADDVFQETVLRALKYIASFKPGSSFKAWLFAIAHNEIKRYYKKHRGDKGALSHSTEGIENLDLPADNHTIDSKIVQDIYEVARQLKPRERQVFFLFYDHQFAIHDISQITGLRQGNIKFILNQARAKIKEKLGLRSMR